jgi:hypothetical protein
VADESRPPLRKGGNKIRRQIRKTTRFEVFKRDSFTCQYCGRKAPEILLVIDHIEPVSKGGTNDILNLITACKDCNAGKSDRQLSDSTILDKQRQQLEELQQRKEQIEMMFQWQKGLLDLNDQVTKQLADFWSEQVPGYGLNENGMKALKRLEKRFEIDEIMSAMKIAVEQYLEFDKGEPTKDSVEQAWKKVGGICVVKREEKTAPHRQRLRYIRGILRNRLSYLNERLALELLDQAFAAGATLESLEKHAKAVGSWTGWRTGIEDFIEQQQKYTPDRQESKQTREADTGTHTEGETTSSAPPA